MWRGPTRMAWVGRTPSLTGAKAFCSRDLTTRGTTLLPSTLEARDHPAMPRNTTPTGDESCPVCATQGQRLIYARVKDPITSDSFRIVECVACGLVYTA